MHATVIRKPSVFWHRSFEAKNELFQADPLLTQLNRGEGRHAVARAICYGQRGEIRKRYREG